jgi:hypothetical protein
MKWWCGSAPKVVLRKPRVSFADRLAVRRNQTTDIGKVLPLRGGGGPKGGASSTLPSGGSTSDRSLRLGTRGQVDAITLL